MSDHFDDAGFIVWSRDPRATRAAHFAVIGRGLLILALLALPIGLTLMGIAPPIDSEPELVIRRAVAPLATMTPPAPQAIIGRLRIQG